VTRQLARWLTGAAALVAVGCARPEPRFAAELVTSRGLVYAFDDVGCLAAFVREGKVPPGHLLALGPGAAADSLRARLGGRLLEWSELPARGHDG
jgi:hypothetical protein